MFEFETDEQKEIRFSVRKLARSIIPKYQNESSFGTVPREIFREFGSLGLTGLNIDESYNGLGRVPTTSMLVLEEISKVDLGPAIFLSVHGLASGLISLYGNSAQKDKYLKQLASGELLAAFALTEPQAGSDAAALSSYARLEGDHYILNGEKCYITSAGYADLYVVFAKTEPQKGAQGISAFLVEASAKGLTISPPEKKMGCELSPIASLTFDNLQLPKEALLGEIGQGYKVALSGLAGGRVNIAACANGISEASIDAAIQHLNERKQFGQKLSAFQGLQFMLADMKMKLEAAKLLTWQAAADLEKNKSNSSKVYPSIAKCFATDAAMAITTDAVQLLGGAGYIREYKVERFMRDAKMLQIVEGTNQVQRIIVAREMVNA